MNYAYKTDTTIYKLLKFDISFCTIHNSYLFKNKWANEYNQSFFQEKIDDIKSLLHIQLKNGKNHEHYLYSLMELMSERIEWLDINKVTSPQFFKIYASKINQNINQIDNFISNNEKYQKFIKNDIEKSSNDLHLFDYLKSHSEEMNHYKNIIDFEKGLLLSVNDLYRNALNDLYHYIESIHITAEFIDFKNFNFEHLDTIPTNKKNEKACNINFDKKSIAQLFRILLEEKVIVFHESDKYKNEYEMKKFVQDHFTYLNDKKEHIPIKSFNREYSEMKSREIDYVQKQIKIIDTLSSILDKRKNDLIKIQNKNN